MKLSVEAQFGYFPLVWMFYGRKLNRKINHMHEDLYALSKKITIALSMIYLRKVSLSVLTTENLSNFVKIICIELDMLTWLMTNPFFASVLILVIADPRNAFTYILEDVVSISKCDRVPGSASEIFN